MYVPTARGAKLPEPYEPLPVTVTVFVYATVVQLFGPYAVKVMLPPAGPPAVVGLMTGLPGLFAVPPSDAVSLIEPPSCTGPLA